MPNIRWLLALITAVHRFLYRATGGRIGGTTGKASMLLLTAIGRKSGRRRTTPLLYVERDADEPGAGWVVVASNAGDDRNPAWWLNLQSQPEAEVQVREEHHKVRARRATPEEEAQLWPKLDAAYGYYPDYRRRTRREIPIVLLEPV